MGAYLILTGSSCSHSVAHGYYKIFNILYLFFKTRRRRSPLYRITQDDKYFFTIEVFFGGVVQGFSSVFFSPTVLVQQNNSLISHDKACNTEAPPMIKRYAFLKCDEICGGVVQRGRS